MTELIEKMEMEAILVGDGQGSGWMMNGRKGYLCCFNWCWYGWHEWFVYGLEVTQLLLPIFAGCESDLFLFNDDLLLLIIELMDGWMTRFVEDGL